MSKDYMCVKKTDRLSSAMNNHKDLIDVVHKDFLFLSSNDVKWYKEYKSEEYLKVIVKQKGTVKRISRDDFFKNPKDPILGMVDNGMTIGNVSINHGLLIFDFSYDQSHNVNYRIWNEDRKKFLPVDGNLKAFYFATGHGSVCKIDKLILGKNAIYTPVRNFCIVDRFTGFKDKNKDKIYINDFVKITWDNGSVTRHQVTENISEKSYRHLYNSIQIDYDSSTTINLTLLEFAIHSDSCIVVIDGNVHENPDRYHKLGDISDE